mgnify:CR=1 FL=1
MLFVLTPDMSCRFVAYTLRLGEEIHDILSGRQAPSALQAHKTSSDNKHSVRAVLLKKPCAVLSDESINSRRGSGGNVLSRIRSSIYFTHPWQRA